MGTDDPLYEAKFAVDLLWRMRGGDAAHDDELERAAAGVQQLIERLEGKQAILLGFDPSKPWPPYEC